MVIEIFFIILLLIVLILLFVVYCEVKFDILNFNFLLINFFFKYDKEFLNKSGDNFFFNNLIVWFCLFMFKFKNFLYKFWVKIIFFLLLNNILCGFEKFLFLILLFWFLININFNW